MGSPMDLDDTQIVFEFEKTFSDEPLEEEELEDDGVEHNPDATGICKFFLKGTCVKGSQCPYKHTKGERAVVCKHWLRGLCKKGDSCEFLHEYDLSKMPECYFFFKVWRMFKS